MAHSFGCPRLRERCFGLETTKKGVRRAFADALDRWRQLSSRRNLLAPEQQLGLYGELRVLHALIGRGGAAALDAWIAKDANFPQRHDFRVRGADLEIKTTRFTSRRHFIHGLQQLVPAPDIKLFILSLRVEPAGAQPGISLSDCVQGIKERLAGHHHALATFEDQLQSAQYSEIDSSFYTEKLRLADSPRLIRVNDDCPRITPSIVLSALPPDTAARIDDVSYIINLEGLGFDHKSSEYEALFGSMDLDKE
jgi:hypothetical protein